MTRGFPCIPGSSSLLLAVAATVTLGCGDDARSSASGSASASATTSASLDPTTGASDGTVGASEGSVTQGSMSEGLTTGSASEVTGPPTSTDPTTATATATESATATETDATTATTGAVSASSSTGEPGPVCGNGLLEEGEECDDGDDLDKNACSNACTRVPCDQQEGGEDLDGVLSYIWISNSSQGTVSKINTKTAVEEGRYRVVGGSPSRTSVNLEGDVAVSSRDPGGVTKIAAKEANCVDMNGDGVITTSTGPNDVKALGQDECVIWTKPIPSPGYGFGPRATAWDGGVQDPDTCKYSAPRLWIGWMDAQSMAHFERLDGATGATLDKVDYPWQAGQYSPYGGAVDALGNFYATGLNTAPTIKIDAKTLELTNLGNPNGCKYGMTLDGNGDIWAGACFGEGVYHWDHTTNIWTTLPNSGGTRVNGIMADADGNVWGAGSSNCRLVHIDSKTKSYVNNNIPLPGCSNPWGVSIDFEGYVWVVDMSASRAFKVDPDTYQVVAQVTGLVGPYTYSDMTGVALKQQVVPQ